MVRTIVIVGQNLAQASKGKTPFEGTQSGKTLRQWMELAGLRETLGTRIKLVNVLNRKTKGNRPLTSREVSRALSRLARDVEGADLVVTLGRQASVAVRKSAYLVRGKMPAGLELEHPSGKNRNLNDPKVRAAQPERLRRAIYLTLNP